MDRVNKKPESGSLYNDLGEPDTIGTLTREQWKREAPKAATRPVQVAVPQPRNWRKDAACIGRPTSWWFPQKLENGKNRTDPARVVSPWACAVCDDCPVSSECLEWALDNEWKAFSGIWAGTSPFERQSIRRKRMRDRIKKRKGAA